MVERISRYERLIVNFTSVDFQHCLRQVQLDDFDYGVIVRKESALKI